jgi:hypothetical protein
MLVAAAPTADLDALRKMLRRRDLVLEIRDEMKITPEIEQHLIELLDQELTKTRAETGATVEIPRQAAGWLLDILEERHRKRGRQRSDDIGRDIIVNIGRALKDQHLAAGKSAQHAHDDAAEEAARLAQQHGIKLRPSTIGRLMQNRR